MFAETERILEKNIASIIKRELLKDKKIYLHPASENSEFVAFCLDILGYKVEYVIDENEEFNGCSLRGIGIKTFAETMIPYKEDCIVLLTTPVRNEKDLLELYRFDYMQIWEGLKRFSVFYDINAPHSKRFFSVSSCGEKFSSQLFHCFFTMKRAIKTLKEYQKKYSKVFIFPHRSLGDMVFLSKFFDAYEKEGFALLVVGNACAMAAKISGIKNVVSITQEQMNSFVRCKDFMGNDLDGIYIPHYHYSDNLYKIPVNYFTPLQEINFRVAYEYDIKFLDCYKARFEQLYGKNVNAEKTLEQTRSRSNSNKKTKIKQIILSPYAKSIVESINLVFWEELVKALKSMGYSVLTNINGVNERPVFGTDPLIVSIANIKKVVEESSCFIGIRSGLCDVVCDVDAPKIFLYPCKKKKVPHNFLDFYTFKTIPEAINFSELEIPITDCKSSVNNVVEVFEKLLKENEAEK